jgi:prepilin-type N-terminal cleavage/methylation domain-containing protein
MIATISRPAPRRASDEAGFTLVELMVTLSIMGVVMTVFLGLLASVQTSLVRETNRSSTMDQARLALEALDRDIRSGNFMCVESSGGTLKVYTQSNGSLHWIKYWVASDHSLRRQQYISGAGYQPAVSVANPLGGRVVATGIISPSPFQLSSGVYGSRLVTINLSVKAPAEAGSNDSTSQGVPAISSSIAIRNYDSAISSCQS